MAPKSLVLPAALLLLAAAGQVRCGLVASLIPGLSGANGNAIVSGVVPCSTGSSINVATAQPFPNATVQLVCAGSVVANATTDSNGAFAINLGPLVSLQSVLMSLLTGQCRVAVTTPLAACNATLPSATGTLTSTLQVLGSTTATAGTVVGNIGSITFAIVNGLVTFIAAVFTTTA